MSPLHYLFVSLLAAAPVFAAPGAATGPNNIDKRATHYVTFYTRQNCGGSAYIKTIKEHQVIGLSTDWVSVYPVIKSPCRLRYCEDYLCENGWVKDPYDQAPSKSCSSTLFGGVVGQAVKLDCK